MTLILRNFVNLEVQQMGKMKGNKIRRSNVAASGGKRRGEWFPESSVDILKRWIQNCVSGWKYSSTVKCWFRLAKARCLISRSASKQTPALTQVVKYKPECEQRLLQQSHFMGDFILVFSSYFPDLFLQAYVYNSAEIRNGKEIV